MKRHIKIALLAVFCFGLTVHLSAQKEGNIWYFGEYAGINFNVDPVQAETSNKVMDQLEGCATISDPHGRLLFFTDGNIVWNREFKVMQNGTGLLGHNSSTQSAIIVPEPGNTCQYYLFTVDAENGSNGLRYSIVNMTLDGGLGGIRGDTKNISLYPIPPDNTKVTEKLSAVIGNNNNYWIMAHEASTNIYLCYEITSTGISDPVKSQGPISHANELLGYLKFSPDGMRVACAVMGLNLIEICHFDPATGKIINTVGPSFAINNIPKPYGIEFSPNSNLLYVSWNEDGKDFVSQFDLTAGGGTPIPVEASKKNVGSSTQFLYGAVQLAPDGKIYVAKSKKNTYLPDPIDLDMINTPDSISNCNFTYFAFDLKDRKSKDGLPNFVQSFFRQRWFTYEGICFGDETQFEITDITNIQSVEWWFGDPPGGGSNSTAFRPTHQFSKDGVFEVQLRVHYVGGGSEDFFQPVTIYPRPEVDLGPDYDTCHPSVLDADNGGSLCPWTYEWSTGETTQAITVEPRNYDQVFWVRTDNQICQDSDTIIIRACEPCDVFVPTAFSPNGDGRNETIHILGSDFNSIELKIYNSTGLEVFSSTDKDEAWDGTFNGHKLDIGVYVYTLVATCIEGSVVRKQGNITLLR